MAGRWQQMNGRRACRVALFVLFLSPLPSLAVEVAVAGIFPGKALLVVDGGAPRTVAIGQTSAEGVRVLAIEGDAVTIELSGRRQVLRMGQSVVAQASAGGAQESTLAADARGHFVTAGAINGRGVRFIVDTGATMVALGAGEATRIGLDWRKGASGYVQTANGTARAWKVRLDSVRVGDIVVHGVDALVSESDMPLALLGMSFLSRMEIRNDGSTLVLKKRY